MGDIVAENGSVVTERMIEEWSAALDRDEWPSGWRNVGDVVEGKLPRSGANTETISIKVTPAMKAAIDREAKSEGKTASAFVRGLIADSLIASA